MPFTYPTTEIKRRHGPRGYKSYKEFKDWLRDEFVFRCVFCLVREMMSGPSGQDQFAVEHLKPKKKYPLLICTYSNLVYSCMRCNSFKGENGPVLDPCHAAYANHLQVQNDGTITGLTKAGKKLIRLLRLDRSQLTDFRKQCMVLAQLAAQNPGSPFSIAWTAATLSFPADLPDLGSLAPPGGNTKPSGIKTCYFAQKAAGTLSDIY